MLSIDADGTVESIDIDQQTALPQDPMLLDSDDVEQMDEVAVSPGTARIQEISDGIAKASRIRPLLQYSEDQGPILTYFQHTNLTTIILWILALIFTIILEAIPGKFMISTLNQVSNSFTSNDHARLDRIDEPRQRTVDVLLSFVAHERPNVCSFIHVRVILLRSVLC